MDWISIIVDNQSAFDNTFEVVDTVAASSQDVFLSAHAQRNLSIKSNHALNDGYGEIQFRVKGNSSYSTRSQLRNGEGPVHLS